MAILEAQGRNQIRLDRPVLVHVLKLLEPSLDRLDCSNALPEGEVHAPTPQRQEAPTNVTMSTNQRTTLRLVLEGFALGREGLGRSELAPLRRATSEAERDPMATSSACLKPGTWV